MGNAVFPLFLLQMRGYLLVAARRHRRGGLQSGAVDERGGDQIAKTMVACNQSVEEAHYRLNDVWHRR